MRCIWGRPRKSCRTCFPRCDGVDASPIVERVTTLVGAGVQFIALLALNDDGAPSYDHQVAEVFAGLSVPSFVYTPG